MKIVRNKDFEKSDTEIETFESIKELKHPQESETGGNIILDVFNEREINDPGVQALFKRSRDSSLSSFKFCRDYYELPKRTIRANGNTYHIFKPNNFRDVQNFYQDKAGMDMTVSEFKYLTNTCLDKKNQPLI